MKRDNEIARLRRNNLQGERQVLRQRQIVTGLKASASDTTIADALLARFEEALARHRADLSRLTST
jgi:hypothetical protein